MSRPQKKLCACGAWCDYREEDYGPHQGPVLVQDSYGDIVLRHVCRAHLKVAHTQALWPCVDPDPNRTVKVQLARP